VDEARGHEDACHDSIREGHPMAKIGKLPTRGKSPAALDTPTDLSDSAVTKITKALNGLLADAFALYLKTKNFHWHVSGPHFRSYHLLFDEQATEIFETTDELAERVRKLGGTTLKSIGEIASMQRVKDNEEDYVSPLAMLRELMEDNKAMMKNMREAHKIADDNDDIGTAAMLETFLDGAEKRNWFLFEASRGADDTGH
jgi:starvation-inducible DNA-binding protein